MPNPKESCNFLLLRILRAFGSQKGDPNYDVRADIFPVGLPDGHVNIQDFNQWRKQCLPATSATSNSTSIDLGEGLTVTVTTAAPVPATN